MKKYSNGKVTLGIGDGANDVNMIQSADVGFGLMGKEGNQAAAFADYAIPKYKDLRRALFWHGRGFAWRMGTSSSGTNSSSLSSIIILSSRWFAAVAPGEHCCVGDGALQLSLVAAMPSDRPG